MKGIILAGGTGSILCPLTKVNNKQMIYYLLQTLINARH